MNGNSQTEDYEKLMAELELICDESKQGSSFYDFMSAGYKESSRHFLTSSSDLAVAAIQPGGEEDLAKILQVIGKHKAPFAVKAGGHSMTPAFSSTRGIQISMTRFDKIKYEETESGNLLHVGAGCLWGAVYRKAARHSVGVVGGVEPGVGVGGLLLGGGYSLKSSRLGLGIDNIQAFRIVTPKGLILEVSDKSTGEDKELFNALRGGANNFGVVTRFTLKTHPQTMTYGAKLMIPNGEDREQEVKKAIMDHITNEKRNTAVIEIGFRHVLTAGYTIPEYTISANCVLDAPKPKDESEVPFAAFRKIVGDSWNDSSNPGSPWNPVLAAVNTQCFSAPPKAGSAEGASASSQLVEKSSDPGFREMTFREMHLLSDQTYNVASFRRGELCPVKMKTEASQAPAPKNENDADDLATLLEEGVNLLADFAEAILPFIDYEGIFKPIAEVLVDLGTSDLGLFVPSVQTQSATPIQQAPRGGNGTGGPQPPLPPIDNLGETNLRGRFGCIMVSNYTEALVAEVARQAKRASQLMAKNSGRLVVIEVWPFHSSIFDLSEPDAAWPHKRGDPYSPLIASFRWERPADDEFWLKEMNRSLDAILAVAVQERCARTDMPRYLNASLETVPVEMIYGGKAQLEKLGKIRARYDPDDVMSRTGGFKIPLPEKDCA